MDGITPSGLCKNDVVPTADSPTEIYLESVGTAPGGEKIDLRIVNQSEYRAWNVEWNGIKREERGFGLVGTFGVVNLLGPRVAGQPGRPTTSACPSTLCSDTQWNTEVKL